MQEAIVYNIHSSVIITMIVTVLMVASHDILYRDQYCTLVFSQKSRRQSLIIIGVIVHMQTLIDVNQPKPTETQSMSLDPTT